MSETPSTAVTDRCLTVKAEDLPYTTELLDRLALALVDMAKGRKKPDRGFAVFTAAHLRERGIGLVDIPQAGTPTSTIFDVLAPSESTKFGEGGPPTVTVGGQTFYICNYIGDGNGGAAILRREWLEMDAVDIATRLLFCAANVIVITTDWDANPDPRPVLHSMLSMLGELFKPCHEAHMRTLATRGKPASAITRAW